MDEILAHFATNSLYPGEITPDGKIHRFQVDDKDSKKSGWYLGFQNHTRKSGEIFYVVTYGNYKTNDTFKFVSDGVKLSAEDKKALKEQMEKAKEVSEAVRLQVQDEVSYDVKAKWDALPSDGASEYLKRKQLLECKELGIRFAVKGGFYVPMRDVQGKIWSVQRIQDDGGKYFFPGGRVAGCFHTIGDLNGSDTVCVAEGFATAASIYLATKKPSVVAFTSGNLIATARELRASYPSKTFIICADDDKWATKADGTPYNAGLECGNEAARASLGSIVSPRFKDISTKPTDFSDLHLLEGLQFVKNQIEEVKNRKTFCACAWF